VKKPKVRTKPIAAKKQTKIAKLAVKTRPAGPASRKPSANNPPEGINLLADAIATLAAIAAELRQITDDLRNLRGGKEEPEVEALVVTEVETPEGFEEES
jgi:hypothetical protein